MNGIRLCEEYTLVGVTCRKCKIPMKESKGHIYHKRRKWKCPKYAKVRMQKPGPKSAI